MRHEEKEGKLSDFLCSHSNAVLVRSRSHYLCIRKNLSARRPSRVNIQIKKWTRHHRSPNIKVRFGRALHECSLTSLNACGFSPPWKACTRRTTIPIRGLAGLKREAFDSCEEFIKPPCCMMMKRVPPPLLRWKGFLEVWYWEKCYKKLHSITRKEYCKMSENESVTNVTNVTTIFRPRHA